MALKKKFIEVEIPIIEETISVLGSPETLNKKTIKLDLSRKLKGKGLEITFLILNKNNKLEAHPKNLLLMRSYIQRMMRKRVNYVEDSFSASCKDISVRIKPFLITRKKVSRAIRNNLRRTSREFILEYVKGKTFMELAKSVIYGDLQKEMHPKLKKVYPLSLCEIRILETNDIEKADLELKEEKILEPKEETIQIQEEKEEIVEEKPKKSSKKVKEKKKNKMTNDIQNCLVLIKPDGLVKSLTGNIISVLSETKLKIIGAKIVSVKKELAEKHYHKLKEEKGDKIFEGTIKYIMGHYHTNRVLALVYSGENAIEKIRALAGSTNPEKADPVSIRGKYGRINSTTGVFENVIHASDSEENAKREIQLWFAPEELSEEIYPIKKEKISIEKIDWA